MIRLYGVGLLTLMTLVSFQVNAQKKRAKELNGAANTIEQMFGKAIEPSPDYKTAELLVAEAQLQLDKGEVAMANSLVRKSISTYPTKAVFKYARQICQMPDINTANLIMDELYARARDLPEQQIMLLETFPSTLEDGKMVAKVKNIDKDRALFHFAYEAYKINKEFGGVKRTERNIQTLLDLNIIKKTSSPFDFEYVQSQQSKIELAILQKDFHKAITLAREQAGGERDNIMVSYIYLEKGDYSQALKVAGGLSEAFLPARLKLEFMAQALQGDGETALKTYDKIKKQPQFFLSNDMFYYLAVADITKKDYNNALINLDQAFNYKMGNFMEGMEILFTDKWKLYKVMGDAFAGLKQFEKAKDNYNIALLYNPEYEPAIAALAGLETILVTTISKDKEPPLIYITEPSLARGLKVTSTGSKVMVRGSAKDPSGIKEVTLNSKIIYSQQGGDFWGEVTLTAGMNKIEVLAIDMAGNKAVQLLEIEKSDQVIAQAEVVPVAATEGKNYALFVAAQNYTDSAIPSLENPVADAVRLKLILKNNYNFADANIISLFNPESNDLRRQLLELTNVLQPEDKLVIFYAGHGIWVDKEKKGYWLLTDAKRNDSNTWLPNKDVLDLIAKIPARHTLLITDACFSGSVFKTRGLGESAPVALQEMDNKISRIAITSGNDTEVPDESVFMKYLVKALSENKDKYLTAQKMFINQIIEAVMTESKTEPRYGTLELAGHVGGDFIFTKK